MPAALYKARAQADVVDVPARTVVALEGSSEPGSEGFQRALGALYGIAYTMKFARKAARRRTPFKIGPLEGVWWADVPDGAFFTAPRRTWRWRLRLALPDDATEAELAQVVRAATTKAGGKLFGSAEAPRAELERVPAARCGRFLHVGPYATEPESLARIRAAMTDRGLDPANGHTEVYLSDPRRTAPERNKTVLLVAVASDRKPSPAKTAPRRGRRSPAFN